MCNACEQKEACTTSERGRSVSIHPQEEFLQELRADKKTSEGRARLRERVVAEHSLARVGQIQGNRARYRGARKNTFDVRRTVAVANLQAVARLRAA